MKKLLILTIFCLFLCSCKDKSIKFGEIEYYPSFLWVDARITPVVKTMDCDFSIDAQNDSTSFAEFQFVDNAGSPVTGLEVKVNGVKAEQNRFRIYSDTKSVELEFTFTPESESGKHQGYLKLINHNLDRLDSQTLSAGQPADAFQWTLYFDKSMNPLAFAILCVALTILIASIIWLLFLRQIFYKQFRAINKMLIIPNQAPINIRFKGARKVIIDSSPHSQSLWNRIWTGKILYLTNPKITSPITLLPTSRGRQVLFLANPTNYRCLTNPIDIQPVRIDDIINHQQLILQ